MYRSMAEQDIKENEMTVANSVDYVRGLSGKTSVLIALSTLLSKTIKSVGSVGDNDLKNVGICFGYSFGTYDGSGINGMFLSIEVVGYYFQLKVSYTGDSIKFRVYNYRDSLWTSWKSISFTE